jgi:hypothetical protein
MQWLAWQGAQISIPLGHSPDYDLIAELDGRLLRVQVKTSTCRQKNRWAVMVCTRGGNQSWTGLVKRLDPSRYDALFVHVGDGRRWFIPSAEIEARSAIRLGGPKYVEFEVDRGWPLPPRRALDPRLESNSRHRGDARAAKGTRL